MLDYDTLRRLDIRCTSCNADLSDNLTIQGHHLDIKPCEFCADARRNERDLQRRIEELRDDVRWHESDSDEMRDEVDDLNMEIEELKETIADLQKQPAPA